MANWYLVPALVKLREQINAAAPKRSKSSDGTIGDAAHKATKSDHNADPNGAVRAFDVTHDPLDGCDCEQIANNVRLSGDPRISYIIWDHKIANSGQEWRPYYGKNPHDKHCHFSIKDDTKLENDIRPWKIGDITYKETPGDSQKPQAATKLPTIKRGAKGDAVKLLQSYLNLTADGTFGPLTEKAVKAFQLTRDLSVDGIVGPATWAALKAAAEAPAKTTPQGVAATAPANSFDRIMEWVIYDEGGELNVSPHEPGGASRYGVSIDAYSRYLGRKATIDDLKNLTPEIAAKVYAKDYWTPYIAKLPAGLNYAAFDLGINSGVNIVDDFVERAKATNGDLLGQIEAVCSQRLAYLRQNKNWPTYGKGWTNRVNRVRVRALQLAGLI